MPRGKGEIRIAAPVPGTCPVCATKHERQEPHDLNSLYYRNQFYRRHRRFPTWADALRHCSELTRAVWTEKLKRAGIEVVFPENELNRVENETCGNAEHLCRTDPEQETGGKARRKT